VRFNLSVVFVANEGAGLLRSEERQAMFRAVLFCLMTVLVLRPARGGDWPQWLGPQRNGSSLEKVEPWEVDPPIAWRVEVGSGFSSPVVAGGRVFIHARVEQLQEEEVIAFDALTGTEKWRDKYDRPAYISAVGGGPAATPAIVGNRVFTYGISGVLSCYEADSGKRLWQRDVYRGFKAEVPRFGVCCSPLVVGNHVVVSVGGKQTALAAFDAQTGELAWQGFDEPASTASPILFRAPGQDVTDQTALFVTSLRLLAVDPLDGKLSWEAPLIFKPSGPAPTPLAVGDVLVTSNSNDGTVATRITQSTNGVRAEHLWTKKDIGGYFSSGVRCGDQQVCLVTNVLNPLPSATLRCLDVSTGEEQWNVPAVGYFHAGVILLANKRLLVLDDAGTLKLYQIGAKECVPLAKATVCKGTLVTPAFSNGLLFARDGTELVCVRVGTP